MPGAFPHYTAASQRLIEIEAAHDRALAEQELDAIHREAEVEPQQRVVRRPRIDYAAEPMKNWPVDMLRAYEGREPAEALPPVQRRILVRLLHRRGWTDAEVADRLRMTLYTAARIRSDLRLPANLSGLIEFRATA